MPNPQCSIQEKHCVPCEGAMPPLTSTAAQEFLQQLAQGWQISGDNKELSHDFKFKNYYHTMAFVNAIAFMAHYENHHPDLEVGYNHCLVRFTTHAIGGLSENDFICASKVDAILSPFMENLYARK
jgi:4a-hydroxytetrahydrobiopterin dehydratase